MEKQPSNASGKRYDPLWHVLELILLVHLVMTRATRLTILTTPNRKGSGLACDVGASSFPSFDTC